MGDGSLLAGRPGIGRFPRLLVPAAPTDRRSAGGARSPASSRVSGVPVGSGGACGELVVRSDPARACLRLVWRRRRLRFALLALLVASPLLAGGWLWLRHSSLVAVRAVHVKRCPRPLTPGLSSGPARRRAPHEHLLTCASARPARRRRAVSRSTCAGDGKSARSAYPRDRAAARCRPDGGECAHGCGNDGVVLSVPRCSPAHYPRLTGALRALRGTARPRRIPARCPDSPGRRPRAACAGCRARVHRAHVGHAADANETSLAHRRRGADPMRSGSCSHVWSSTSELGGRLLRGTCASA